MPATEILYTMGQYRALKAAVASGVASVSYEGKTTTYRSLDEMLRLLGNIERELGISQPPQTILVTHDPGYGGLGGTASDYDGSLVSGF